jgi:hypothetical protein
MDGMFPALLLEDVFLWQDTIGYVALVHDQLRHCCFRLTGI